MKVHCRIQKVQSALRLLVTIVVLKVPYFWTSFHHILEQKSSSIAPTFNCTFCAVDIASCES